MKASARKTSCGAARSSRRFPYWLESEDDAIRRLWPDVERLRGVLLWRCAATISRRARALGLPYVRQARRPWSAKELKFLRAHHATMTAREIGDRLGRTASEVYAAGQRLGLPGKVQFIDWQRHDRTLLARHAQGWSDAEIAAEIGCSVKAVQARRARVHKLPTNGRSDRLRRRVGQKTREILERKGVESLAQLRVEAHRKFARESGWPENLRLRAVQILNALWDRGPMTRREIAEAVGMPWKGSRKSLVSNDPEGSYLAHLMARGLVIALKRAAKVTGRGASQNVYSIALTVQRGDPSTWPETAISSTSTPARRSEEDSHEQPNQSQDDIRVHHHAA